MAANNQEPLSFARLVTREERRPAYPQSLVELAYEQLLSMLVTMKIAPGAHIGIEALARQLDISQTPIREALTLLEAQKLAYKIPNVGFRAAELLTRREVHDLFDLRLLIEPAAAAFAAQKADDGALARLAGLAGEMSDAQTGNELAYAHFAEGDANLHRLVAAASGNRFIAETVEGLHAHLHIFRFLFKTNATTKALQEHEAIIAALLARDAVAAEGAMRAHLEASRARMNVVLEEQERLAAAQTPIEPGGGSRRGRSRRR
ncbi:DNA-binding GntR family transcriptional regulator [Ancylobacter aquaticus]|uniref:DNA-binding GntR family transcriptional regulator n=1 Tax=Ancylobacter aquaticus TaxID=100 RepID=A0A4R1I4N9_ANCAQ|nr:GntR family transcriptional regulator [Ancylobacter aquaticus]TCK30257.1 DNA-binding GntR family transcriptional regulator [Ancylobacter aquaticus]